MIYYVKGNIFDTPAKVLVNPVNTKGTTIRPINRAFKMYFPDANIVYKYYCQQDMLDIGKLALHKNTDGTKRWVLDLPVATEDLTPTLSYVEQGLKKLVDCYQYKGIESLAISGLTFSGHYYQVNKLKAMRDKYLSKLKIPVYIYPYADNDLAKDSYDKSITTIANLNTEHDSWKNNYFLSRVGYDDYINCDGIIRSDCPMYRFSFMPWYANTKKLKLIANTDKLDTLTWLQEYSVKLVF